MERCHWNENIQENYPDSKVHGANMGPLWGWQDPGGPLVGPMNLAIRVGQYHSCWYFVSLHSNKTNTMKHIHSLLHMTYLYVNSLRLGALSPERCQVIIWTNAGILFIGPSETNVSEILTKVYTFWLKKMHLKMSSDKWQPFCLSPSVVNQPWFQASWWTQSALM